MGKDLTMVKEDEEGFPSLHHELVDLRPSLYRKDKRLILIVLIPIYVRLHHLTYLMVLSIYHIQLDFIRRQIIEDHIL